MPEEKYLINEPVQTFHDIRSIVELVDALVNYAFLRGVSDIHIDPTPEGVVIKFRIDGVLAHIDTLSFGIHEEIIARIKIIAGLRTDIHFVPQDGRFGYSHGIRNFDVRVSIIPTHHGENAVLRLLVGSEEETTLESLGFSNENTEKIKGCLRHHQGMILVTGPTGSGKTTTLYTLVKLLASGKTSIITLEDPVEYALRGIRQIQIRERHGVTFANGLRSIIRQDPDIIMVGEIRDSETAQISTNISLTGHLLLSTLHTNSALGTIPRLIDMGIDPYLVASTLSCVIAQRLVRKTCPECKGAHCASCSDSGYKGRLVVSEVLVIDEELRKYIMTRISPAEIARYAAAKGFRTLYEDGLDKIAQGITTKEEILRVLHE
jgi:type II secretory ATPase GspE/PulE/Tfp pilus assembly ATPase PilB-like protein